MDNDLANRDSEYIFDDRNEKFKTLKGILIGVLSGYVFEILITFLFSAVMSFTQISDSVIGLFAYVAVITSSFVCGFVCVTVARKNGLVNGFISGLVFFAVHLSLALLFGSADLMSLFIFGLIEVLLSAVGGVVRINLGK